jgi:hypothetical protein
MPANQYAAGALPTADRDASGLGVAALVVAGLALAADAALIAQPLPGREMSTTEYAILDAKDMIDEGSLSEGCLALEHALTGGPGGAPVGVDIATMAASCADHRIAEVFEEPPGRRGADLESLAESPLLDAPRRERVQAEIARLRALPRPGDATTPGASPIVNGRLPPEVIQRIVRQHFPQIRRCYERALATKPDLTGRVVTRFVIGRDGSVMTASDGGSDLGDSAVQACVIAVFQGLSFPQPDGGIVTVTYPIVFKSG